jgi:uroporphyrinogen-III synthase
MSGAPLRGRRIVVTRAHLQSGGLQQKLEQNGAEVLLLPTIETVAPESYAPLDRALRAAPSFDWLVLTSANAVRVLGERLSHLCLDIEALRHAKVAVVGPSTAAAWQQLGLDVDLIPATYVGEALAAALAPRVKGRKVLLVCAAAARDVVPVRLARAGAELTVVDAYRTVVPAHAVGRARSIFSGKQVPDAVVFTSGSTVAHLLEVLRGARLSLPSQVACVSIGPVTSAAVREAGLAVAAEARSPSLDDLVGACVRLFALM